MRSSSNIFQQTDYIRASDPFISNDNRRHPSLSFGQALRNCRCVLLRPPDMANQWPLWTDPNDETVLHQRNKQPHYELSQVHTVASQLKIICSHDNLILLAYSMPKSPTDQSTIYGDLLNLKPGITDLCACLPSIPRENMGCSPIIITLLQKMQNMLCCFSQRPAHSSSESVSQCTSQKRKWSQRFWSSSCRTKPTIPTSTR